MTTDHSASASSAGWLDTHLSDLTQGMVSLRCATQELDSWGHTLGRLLCSGARLMVAGNGGSAGEAQHFTAELVGRFLGERRPLSAICLSAETSSLTAILNDYGADEVFARQVEAHGRPGDVLVLLSTSGRSPNLLRAAQRARDHGIEVWSMTGPAPNPLANLSSQSICAASSSTAAVQELHLIAVHAICAALDAYLADNPRVARGALAVVQRRQSAPAAQKGAVA